MAKPSDAEKVTLSRDQIPRDEKPTQRIPKELIDQLFSVADGPQGLTGPDGLLKQLTSALVNRALEVEMSNHLGYENGEEAPDDQPNRRNGRRIKTVRTDRGHIDVEVPRDRDGSFEPKLIAKHQRSFDGFDDKILSMYARGMSTRDIERHLLELYGVNVSPDLVTFTGCRRTSSPVPSSRMTIRPTVTARFFRPARGLASPPCSWALKFSSLVCSRPRASAARIWPHRSFRSATSLH